MVVPNFLAFQNLWWSIANLLPIRPLDGGNVTAELFGMSSRTPHLDRGRHRRGHLGLHPRPVLRRLLRPVPGLQQLAGDPGRAGRLEHRRVRRGGARSRSRSAPRRGWPGPGPPHVDAHRPEPGDGRPIADSVGSWPPGAAGVERAAGRATGPRPSRSSIASGRAPTRSCGPAQPWPPERRRPSSCSRPPTWPSPAARRTWSPPTSSPGRAPPPLWPDASSTGPTVTGREGAATLQTHLHYGDRFREAAEVGEAVFAAEPASPAQTAFEVACSWARSRRDRSRAALAGEGR